MYCVWVRVSEVGESPLDEETEEAEGLEVGTNPAGVMKSLSAQCWVNVQASPASLSTLDHNSRTGLRTDRWTCHFNLHPGENTFVVCLPILTS